MPRISKSEEDRRYASVIRHLDAYKAARFRNGDDKTAVASALGLSPERMYRILSGSADTLTLRDHDHRKYAQHLDPGAARLPGRKDDMKKYIPGTLAIALAYLFLILAFTIGIKALVSLPVIVYAQYRLLRRAKKQPLPKQ